LRRLGGLHSLVNSRLTGGLSGIGGLHGGINGGLIGCLGIVGGCYRSVDSGLIVGSGGRCAKAASQGNEEEYGDNKTDDGRALHRAFLSRNTATDHEDNTFNCIIAVLGVEEYSAAGLMVDIYCCDDLQVLGPFSGIGLSLFIYPRINTKKH
jgi:hypothetical protein